jgi:hypothetical protein
MVSLLTALNTAAAAGSTIGIAASDAADAARTNVKILAFQGYGQDCAWLPDSSSTSFDKKNVRDGQYVPWGPIHFYTKVGGTGTPVNAQAANLVGYFNGTVAAPFPNGYQDLITLAAKGSTVPDCAMNVKRTTEVGPVSAYSPTGACGCFWENAATGSTTCTTCTKASDCTNAATPKCNYGYCEAN